MFDRSKSRPEQPAVTVKAQCPGCGDVTVPSRAVVLKVVEYAEHESTYDFVCSGCGVTVEKPATREIVRLLSTCRGVRVVRLTIPAEWREGGRSGAAIGHDDLLDLLIGLRDTADVAAAAMRRQG